eukprot:CAMPEP_0196578556 /NCGR_PEP_ID=MMETSP1081-20130531/7439_1 /TAXON_ID=36882 /ORGANISM="Pyramimonas amylifera, Strain CCMP720" /LENGTH=133 /DNA_ID=CAMNT_0041897817 /DNA_START=69 /DNA_END=466 /DNA_ORIENTATION=+
MLRHLTTKSAEPPQLHEVVATLHNLQHILNLARPHQARANLEALLTEEVARKKAALAVLRQKRVETQALLREAQGRLPELGVDLDDPDRLDMVPNTKQVIQGNLPQPPTIEVKDEEQNLEESSNLPVGSHKLT